MTPHVTRVLNRAFFHLLESNSVGSVLGTMLKLRMTIVEKIVENIPSLHWRPVLVTGFNIALKERDTL